MSIRLALTALGFAITFWAGICSAQEGVAEADRVIPEVGPATINEFVLASPEARSIVVDRELDLNHDQILSWYEIRPLLTALARSARSKSDARNLTNHRQGSWIYNSSPLPIAGNVDLSRYWARGGYLTGVYSGFDIYTGEYLLVVPTASNSASSRRDFNPNAGLFTSRRAVKLNSVHHELISTGSEELSLVDEEFHRLFASLPGEQRSALLAADAAGDNDGMVTVQEFDDFNERRLSRKTRFEADFGEQAYLRVLDLFGVIR